MLHTPQVSTVLLLSCLLLLPSRPPPVVFPWVFSSDPRRWSPSRVLPLLLSSSLVPQPPPPATRAPGWDPSRPRRGTRYENCSAQKRQHHARYLCSRGWLAEPASCKAPVQPRLAHRSEMQMYTSEICSSGQRPCRRRPSCDLLSALAPLLHASLCAALLLHPSGGHMAS